MAVAVAVTMVGSAALAATTWYVDGDASGPAPDGSSWCSAFLTLGEALHPDAASLGDTILMADGIYSPDPGELDDPREATFQLRNGIEIIGGFAGCDAADPDAWDPRQFETILSGDLDGDDDSGGDNSENSYHVVTGSGVVYQAVLDSVTITAGNANGSSMRGRGGGVFNDSGSPILLNCKVVRNAATRAAAMYNYASNPTLIGCTIADNTAQYGGGGVYDSSVGGTDHSTLENCLISNNVSSNGSGGGIYSTEADTILRNCTVVGNTAMAGGGIYSDQSDITLTNCILWLNSDFSGTTESAQLYIYNAISFIDNTCLQGWSGVFGGSLSFGDDPLFVPGPVGCYYLSQVSAGDPETSPCVDAGNDTAQNVDLDDGVTTRSDEVTDGVEVDLGYHYPVINETLAMGDYDRDGAVGLVDYAELVACVTGPRSAELSPCCRIFDFELDDDIDLFDFAEFAVSLTSP